MINNILDASRRIQPFIRNTPLIQSKGLSDLTGAQVHFKLENLQITGSFKARGALNKILSLSEKEKSTGVVSASTGNHGAAVAYAAEQVGIQCTIYVPEKSSSTKLGNMK